MSTGDLLVATAEGDYSIECTSNPCSVSFPKMVAAVDIAIFISYVDSYDFSPTRPNFQGIAIGQLNVYGNEASRESNELIEQLIGLGNHRYHRIFVPSLQNV